MSTFWGWQILYILIHSIKGGAKLPEGGAFFSKGGAKLPEGGANFSKGGAKLVKNAQKGVQIISYSSATFTSGMLAFRA